MHVTETDPSGDIFTLSVVHWNVGISFIIIFFTVSAVGTALVFHGFLGPDPRAAFFTGSWVPIPGCFTFFAALSARVYGAV